MDKHARIYNAHNKADAKYIEWLDAMLETLTGAQARGIPVARHWRLRDLERMA